VSDPDLIEYLLAMVRAEFPQCTDGQADHIDERVRAVWGGQRVHIAKHLRRKRGRPPTAPEVLQRAYADALGTEPTHSITSRHGISRATLYRLVKKGPPGGD
jgi:hypothetical protein